MSTPALTNIVLNSKKKKAWYRSAKVWRHGVMLFFFLFLLHVAYDHQVKGGGPRGTPSVEAYCPFGGLESLYQFLTTGGFIRRIEPSAMVMFAALLLLTLIASRGFCGWICPFGSVQEWLGLLGKKIFKKKFNPTGKLDRALRYFKYVLLVVIIGFTWNLGALVFRNYDPFLAFFHLGKGIDELPWAYAALGVVLLGSLYIERFFCKYACPLGAVLGILGKVGLTKVHREPDGCKSCNICQKKCHAHIDFLSVTTIRDSECNHCMDCVVDCPKPNVLTLRGPRWKFSHPVYAGMLVAGLLGLIGASQLAGKWQTKPAMVSFTDSKGKLEAENIRGWMTLQEISGGYGIPLDRLYREAGIPAQVAPTTAMNRIGSTYNLKFEPEKIREVVSGYVQGKPARQAGALPPPAAKKTAAAAKKQDHAPGEEEPEVKGFMTLNEVALKTGVPKEYILKALGITAKVDPRTPLREWMHEHDKSVQDVRDAVKQYRAGKK
ncbi:MAG: 4Fe-4S binding protein [Bryobacteraceae bacterium]